MAMDLPSDDDGIDLGAAVKEDDLPSDCSDAAIVAPAAPKKKKPRPCARQQLPPLAPRLRAKSGKKQVAKLAKELAIKTDMKKCIAEYIGQPTPQNSVHVLSATSSPHY